VLPLELHRTGLEEQAYKERKRQPLFGGYRDGASAPLCGPHLATFFPVPISPASVVPFPPQLLLWWHRQDSLTIKAPQTSSSNSVPASHHAPVGTPPFALAPRPAACAMEEIDLLLPGLKVSTGLIRQRPLRKERSTVVWPPVSSILSPPVGTKRQCQAAWGESSEESVVPAKRVQVRRDSGQCPLRFLRISPSPSSSSPSSSSVSVEFLPALQTCQAGITTDMLQHLSTSPDTASSCYFGDKEATYHANSTTAKDPVVSLGTSSGVQMMYPKSTSLGAEVGGCAGKEEGALSGMGDVSTLRLGQTLSCAGALISDTDSIGEQCHVIPAGTPLVQTSATACGTKKAVCLSIDLQQSTTARYGLTRTEKWHERISLATLRLRQNSLLPAHLHPEASTSLVSK
jgi:hypothetical protein